MAASNELITEWLTRQAEAATRTFQGVANEANSHEMLNFVSTVVAYSAAVEGITRNMSGRQEAAAAITAEIAPTAIDHAEASHDGDAVAVAQSAAISTEHAPTNGDAAAVTQFCKARRKLQAPKEYPATPRKPKPMPMPRLTTTIERTC